MTSDKSLPMTHRPADFPVHFLFLDRCTLVEVLLAARHGEFHLGPAVFEIDRQGDQRGAAFLGGCFQLFNFPAMGQELSLGGGDVIERAGLLVGVDVQVVEDQLAALDAGERVVELRPAGTQALDLAANQHDAALQAGIDVVFVQCTAIVDPGREIVPLVLSGFALGDHIHNGTSPAGCREGLAGRTVSNKD